MCYEGMVGGVDITHRMNLFRARLALCYTCTVIRNIRDLARSRFASPMIATWPWKCAAGAPSLQGIRVDQASVIVIMAIRNTMQSFVALTLFFDDLEYLHPP